MRFLKESIRAGVTSIHSIHFIIHRRKTPPQPRPPSMIWPSLTSPTSSATLCPSLTVVSHRGPSSPQDLTSFLPRGLCICCSFFLEYFPPTASHRKGRANSSEVPWPLWRVRIPYFTPGPLLVSFSAWITILKYFIYAYAYLLCREKKESKNYICFVCSFI